MTVTVSEAVGFNYVATISCTLEDNDYLNCDHIAQLAYEKGKKIIPGLYYCDIHQDGKDIIFTLGYLSTLSEEEIKGRLYAVVYSSIACSPELESISARDIYIEKNQNL